MSSPAANSHPCSGQSRKNFFHTLFFRELLIFVLTFFFFAFWALEGIDPHHDGVMLIPAIRVAQGAAVFRDVFCQYGLLVPLLQGSAVAVFGAELLVIRLLTVLFYAGSAVLLDLLWRRFLPGKISWLVPVLFCLLSPCTMATFHSWSSVYALFFMLLYAFFAIRFLEDHRRSIWNLFFAGISIALTWMCRMPCGAVTLLAAVIVFGITNLFAGKARKTVISEVITLSAGFITVISAGVVYILYHGAWDDFCRQSFGYVTEFAHTRGGSGSWQYFCDSIFPFYQDGLWFFNSLFAFLPICALIMLYFAGRKGFTGGGEAMRKQLPFIALLVLGLGSWHQYYPVPCIRHLYWGGIPMIGAYILLFSYLWTVKKVWSRTLLVLLGIVLLMATASRICGMWIRGGFLLWQQKNVPGVRHIFLNSSEAKLVDLADCVTQMPEYLQQRGVLVIGEDSLFLAMTKVCDFRHICFYNVKSRQYPDYESRQQEYIYSRRPVILSDREIFFPGYVVFRKTVYMGKLYCLLVPLN